MCERGLCKGHLKTCFNFVDLLHDTSSAETAYSWSCELFWIASFYLKMFLILDKRSEFWDMHEEKKSKLWDVKGIFTQLWKIKIKKGDLKKSICWRSSLFQFHFNWTRLFISISESIPFLYLYCRFNYTSQISQIVTEMDQIVCFKPDHEEELRTIFMSHPTVPVFLLAVFVFNHLP